MRQGRWLLVARRLAKPDARATAHSRATCYKSSGAFMNQASLLAVPVAPKARAGRTFYLTTVEADDARLSADCRTQSKHTVPASYAYHSSIFAGRRASTRHISYRATTAHGTYCAARHERRCARPYTPGSKYLLRVDIAHASAHLRTLGRN